MKSHRTEFAATMYVLERGTGGRVKFTDADTIDVWYDALQDIDIDVLKRAVKMFLATETNWPTIARIRALATEQVRGVLPDAGESWQRVRRVAKSFGFPDEFNEAKATLDDASRAAGDAIGWERICMCPVTDLGTLFAQYRDRYQAIEGRKRRLEQAPESVRPRIATGAKLIETASSNLKGIE
mgnify:CR=1 FL=1